MPGRKNAQNTSGSITLFAAAIVLPLMLFLLSLSADIRAYVLARERAQHALDETGLYSYRFINAGHSGSAGVPGSGFAVTRAEAYIRRFPDVAPKTSISQEGDMLYLEYAGHVPLHFASFFSRFFSSPDELSIPVQARTRVRGTVFDSVIAVDRSCYLSPSGSSEDAAWGDREEWPSSRLFEREFRTGLPARIATQQCFNPSFSALKTAAVESYAALHSFSLNRTAVGFFPGAHEWFTVLRPLSRTGDPPEADFIESISGNVACAAVAEDDESPRHYWFPDRQSQGSDALGGKPSMFKEHWKYDPAYDEVLTASEVIWTRAALSGAMDTRKEPETHLVIEDLLPVMFASGSSHDRGGLRNRAVRSIFLLAGDVPRSRGVRFGDPGDDSLRQKLHDAFERYRTWLKTWNSPAAGGGDLAILRFYYILLQPRYSDLSCDSTRLSELRDFLEEESLIDGAKKEYFNIRFSVAADGDSAGAKIMGALLLENKAGVISW